MLEHGIAPATGVGYEIANSLRFNDNDSAYLSRTPASAGNRKTWTWSGWVKRGEISAESVLFSAVTDGNNYSYIRLNGSDQFDYTRVLSAAVDGQKTSSAVYRDVSAWYHLMVVEDAINTSIKLYVNGSEITDTATDNPPSNVNASINNNVSHSFGGTNGGIGFDYIDGYLAEVHFIDGQALDPSNFGETGDYGEWKPIKYTGAYGVNGFYLDFENSGSLGADVSGNGNNWTPTNLAATDQMLDSPTNNFATMNVLGAEADQFTNQEGNLKSTTNVAAYNVIQGSFGVSTGKWYWEVEIQNVVGTNGGTGRCNIGIQNSNGNLNNYIGSDANGWAYNFDGLKLNSGAASYGASFTSGDIIGIALDMDAGTITFYKNNTSQGQAFSGITGEVHPAISAYQSGGYQSGGILNAGQDSSFAGNKTAQGNADGNGYGDFYYTPPTGYLALCTQNLPDPTVIPSEHFAANLRTGTGGNTSVSGMPFAPDFVWIKARSFADWHQSFDILRGTLNRLHSNATSAESTEPNTLTAFNSDGYSLGGSGGTNGSGKTFVDWCWKANGSGVSNTNGTITSTVSANQDAGFSIVSYTGTGSNATIGHGLNSAPEIVITKSRDASRSWSVLTSVAGYSWASGYLDSAGSFGDASSIGAPTSSVLNVQSQVVLNSSGEKYIAYCFHSVDGYSKVGSYTGNGSADGTFVYTGFRPAYVMVKKTDSAASWYIYDVERDTFNVMGNIIAPDSSAAEVTGVDDMDFLSNGFKLRGWGGYVNASGGNYIFVAFAESPFKQTNAR